ncbi:MAG: glycosyltransferase [Phycisphaerae bacterium]
MSGPIRVLHLFDASARWEQRVGATQLIEKLPPGRFASYWATLDPHTRHLLDRGDRRMDCVSTIRGSDALAAPRLVDRIERDNIGLIHAWGVQAAVVAAQAGTPAPIVVELFDPGVSDLDSKKLRSIMPIARLALACTSGTVQRRLVEKGVAADRCVVIRPGVDFARINAARKRPLRQALNVDEDARVFLTAEPATRGGGQMAAFWSLGVRSFLKTPQAEVLIVPGCSVEQARIARLARQLKLGACLRCPGTAVPFEDLIAVADGLLLPSSSDVPTTAIAWAMAAGAPVVGSAVFATAELIAHKHNGLLIKPAPVRSMALKLAALLDDCDTLIRLADTARGQAFEVFSIRRYVDQHTRLYDNLLVNQCPAEGITDAALVN